MYYSEDIDQILEANPGDAGYAIVIKKLIEDHKPQAKEMQMFYERYSGKVPIKKRANIDKGSLSLNNRLASDHDGQVIDEIVGYVWGHPIKVTFDQPNPAAEEELKKLFVRVNMDSLDEETGEYSCACGYGSRLLYVDLEGQLRIMNTKPWQTIFVYSNFMEKLGYGLIYYPWTIVDKKGKVRETTKVEFYDTTQVHYFVLDSGKYSRESSDAEDYTNPQDHLFDGVPLVKFRANNLEQSDLYKIKSLVDAYDELVSDAQNELQEFVHAYLVAIGGRIDEEERLKARKTRVFNLPTPESDLKFITKEVNGEFFNSQKDTLNENIFKASKTVDMTTEKFTMGGAESGESRKWRLLGLEFKAIKKERKFTEALREQYKLIKPLWAATKVDFDPDQLTFTYTRALPIDYLYYAEIAMKFMGIIPHEDLLAMLPFVKDPAETYQRLLAEREGLMDLDSPVEEES